jgi:hypothetical protein
VERGMGSSGRQGERIPLFTVNPFTHSLSSVMATAPSPWSIALTQDKHYRKPFVNMLSIRGSSTAGKLPHINYCFS